jgi:sulfocyanin SoxE-like protein
MISTVRWFLMPATAAAFSAAMACAGRTQSPSAEPAPAAAASTPAPARSTPGTPPSSPEWLAIDSANKTVTLTLEVTAGQNPPSALINGYRNGEARIVVPVGWTVRWNWRNADPASPHSLVVVVQREKIPLEGGRSAFSNAMTRMVTEGLPPGRTDQTTFVAEEAGWYWLMCGVPSHALAGEWLEIRVDPDAKTATVQVKKA